jgi:hypothetical protein
MWIAGTAGLVAVARTSYAAAGVGAYPVHVIAPASLGIVAVI